MLRSPKETSAPASELAAVATLDVASEPRRPSVRPPRPRAAERALTASGWAMLAIKLTLGVTLASHFLYALFVPFLNVAVLRAGENPWQTAIDLGIPKAFPYGPGMFYALLLPRWIVSRLVPADPLAVTWVHLLAARLPLLAADLAVLWILIEGFQVHAARAAVLWWMSPIVLYVTYVHGQLDVIPTAVLLASLMLLTRGQTTAAAVALGIGLATKLHLLVALPFMAVFAFRRDSSVREGLQFVALSLAVFAAVLFPWVLNPGFRTMVFKTDEQARLFRVSIEYLPFLRVYVAPLVIGLLLLQFASYRKVNRDMLLMFLGLAYTVLITLIPPAHAYYIWPLPFVIYFFSQQTISTRVPLWAFNVSCLAYLIFGSDSTVLESLHVLRPAQASVATPLSFLAAHGVDAVAVNSLLYTTLQVAVLTIAAMMYRHGVQSNIIYRPRTRPILVGIGGDSGGGKHTTRDLLGDLFGGGNTLTVDGDDMHRWERGHEMWRVVSHLSPEANDLYLLFDHTRALKHGLTITKVRYDHGTGRFTEPVRVSPSRFVFVVGLHPFYLRRMRDLLDVKIYVEPDEALRLEWKRERDVRDRGYSDQQVLEQIRAREPDAASYIRPQRRFADLVVSCYRTASSELGVRVQVDNGLPLEPMIEQLQALAGTSVTLERNDDLLHQMISIEGRLTAEQTQTIARACIPQLNELVAPDAKWHADHNGAIQLCFLMVLSDRLRDDSETAA